MKKIITLALFLYSFNLQSQSMIGFKGGLNYTSNFISGSSYNTSFKIGYNGGLVLEQFLSSKFSLGVDVLYQSNGFINKIIFTGVPSMPSDIISRYNFNYLSVPINFGFYISNKQSIFIKVGLCTSYLLNASSISSGGQSVGGDERDIVSDISDSHKKFDIAGLLEIGCRLKLKNKLFLCSSLNYQSSFISNLNTSSTQSWVHHGFNLSAGLKYSISK